MTTGLAQDLMSVTKREFMEKSRLFCDHYDLDEELRRAVVTHRKYFYHQNYVFDNAAVFSPSILSTDLLIRSPDCPLKVLSAPYNFVVPS